MNVRVALYSLIGIALGLLVTEWNMPKLLSLANSGERTVGTVVELRCQDHGSFVYGFDVDGKRYRGIGRDAPFLCGAAALGRSVDVYYLPANPQSSISGSPAESLRRQNSNALLATLGFGVMFGLGAHRIGK
jgi:hypothetical protein